MSATTRQTDLMEPRFLALILSGFGGLLALLHLYGGLFPSGINWGIHMFAFFPPAVTFGAPLLMLLALVPSVQRAVISTFELLIQKFQHLDRVWRLAAIVASVAGVALLLWVGRERLFFLGDGLLAIRNLDTVSSPEGIPAAYKNAPFPAFIIWKLSSYFSGAHIEPSGQLAFQVFSIACGVASVFILLMLVKNLAPLPLDRVLASLFVIASGGTQLFFGYVETYTAAYLAVMLFAWLSLAYLDGKLPLVLPSIAFGVLLTSHFGMICVAPAIAFLFYHTVTKGRFVQVAASGLALLGTVVLLLWAGGYSLAGFVDVVLHEGGVHFVPFAERTSGWHAYTVFSSWHFVDLTNLFALLSPFSLVIVGVFTPYVTRRISIRDPQHIFMAIVGVTSFAFAFAVNFDIGMSRDWDLLSPYILGIAIAAAFFLVRGTESALLRRRMLVMMTVITALQTIAYIAVNSNVERSLARVEQLPDNRLWGSGAIAYLYEDLWTYYRDRSEYEQASRFAEQCLVADPTNSRRWSNGAVAFEKAGHLDRSIRTYERAIELGSEYPWVFVNLGSAYSRVGRMDKAISYFQRALQLDPNVPMAAYNLGTLYGANRHEFDKALQYLQRAVTTDSLHAPSWQNLGTCFGAMGKHEEMVWCYERAIELSPHDSAATTMRRILQAHQKQQFHDTRK